MSTDITLCPGVDCPLRNDCFRYRAVAYGRQDSFGASPFDPARGTCDAFDPLARRAPTDAAIRTRAYHRWVAGGRRADTADADWHAARAELDAAFRAQLRAPDNG